MKKTFNLFRVVIKSDYSSKSILAVKSTIFLLLFTAIQVMGNNSHLITSEVELQQQVVTGKVTDITGDPLPGVNILIKGTLIGVTTDVEGNYRLETDDPNAILVFSFIGYRSQEVPIGGRSEIGIILEADVFGLDEVVVVAYGRVSRESLTGSVAVVNQTKLAESTETGFDKMLQGSAAGVSVSSVHGAPGSSAEIRIRGINSINAGQDPLIVIDGVPTNSGDAGYGNSWGGQLSLINPDDIESISVLKDASSAALYGSRAANGVILITTKSGKEGKTNIKLNVQTGFSSYGDNQPFLNSEDLWQLQYEATENAADYFNDPSYDPDNPLSAHYLDPAIKENYTNWWDESIRTSNFNKIELSAIGGNDKTKFYISGSYTNEEGAVITTGFERFTARINIDHQFNEKLDFGVKLNGSYGKKTWYWASNSYSDPINGAWGIFPWRDVYNDDGSFNWVMPENGNVNIIAHLKESPMGDNNIKLLGSSYLNYEIISGLTLKLAASIDNIDVNEEQYEAYDHYWAIYEPYPGWLIKTNIRETTSFLSGILNYNKTFGDHGFDLIIGSEREEFIRDRFSAEGYDIPKDKQYLSYATSQVGGQLANDFTGEWSLQSYLSRLNYNYKRKYYASFSYRRDGSSKFGADNKYGNFIAAGLSWRITEEDFFNVSFIDNLKLSAGYGTSGNDQIGYYDAYGTYSTLTYHSTLTFVPERLPNPDLKWEKSATTNIALDFGLFSRINGRVEVFKKATKDMLMDVPISPTSGFTTITMNAGAMENKGLEVQVNSVNVNAGNLKWTTDLTYSMFRNKVTDLVTSDTLYGGSWRISIEGQPLWQFYVHDFAGVDPGTGLAMWYDEDGNITFSKTQARDKKTGSPYPDYEIGLTNTLSYKGFSVSAFLFARVGNEMYTFYQRYGEGDNPFFSNGTHVRMDRWQEPGDMTSQPKPIKGNPLQADAWDNSRWVSDASFIRLKDLTIGYTLPETLTQRLKMSNVTIYLKGQNIWTYHKSHNFDPEISMYGYVAGPYPLARTYTAGIKLNF